jgi:hypothetical protein
MMRRPDDALYQLALTIEPEAPGPFSLITFNAIVSPPYSDLFDFEWKIDGQTVPGAQTVTVQTAASNLPKLPGGEHTVRVIGRGAREYPDPDQPHIPPTLSVECAFKVSSA